jgi:hypothetical protein
MNALPELYTIARMNKVMYSRFRENIILMTIILIIGLATFITQ